VICFFPCANILMYYSALASFVLLLYTSCSSASKVFQLGVKDGQMEYGGVE